MLFFVKGGDNKVVMFFLIGDLVVEFMFMVEMVLKNN